MNREEILHTAMEYVTKDRAATHGDAEAFFELVGLYWSMHLGHEISATDVAVMMALFKIARLKGKPGYVDNWVDACGYLALGGEIETGARVAPERAE